MNGAYLLYSFFYLRMEKKYILMKCQSGPYIKIKVKKYLKKNLKFDLFLYNCFLEI